MIRAVKALFATVFLIGVFLTPTVAVYFGAKLLEKTPQAKWREELKARYWDAEINWAQVEAANRKREQFDESRQSLEVELNNLHRFFLKGERSDSDPHRDVRAIEQWIVSNIDVSAADHWEGGFTELGIPKFTVPAPADDCEPDRLECVGEIDAIEGSLTGSELTAAEIQACLARLAAAAKESRFVSIREIVIKREGNDRFGVELKLVFRMRYSTVPSPPPPGLVASRGKFKAGPEI